MVLRSLVMAIAAMAFLSFSTASATDNDSAKIKTTVVPDKGVKADTAVGVPAGKIAKEFKVPVDSVLALHAAYKIGWGGISKAYALSQRTEGYSPRDILNMKIEQKMGWGQIAKKLGEKPGESYKPIDPTSGPSDKLDAKADKQQDKMLNKQKRMEDKDARMNDKK